MDDRLFFEPCYQTDAYGGDTVPNQSEIELDTWQPWDALTGGWSFNAGTFGPPLVTLASYSAAHPGATIVNASPTLGGLRIVAGFGAGAWDHFDGYADGVTIGTSGGATTYDFEARPADTSSARSSRTPAHPRLCATSPSPHPGWRTSATPATTACAASCSRTPTARSPAAR